MQLLSDIELMNNLAEGSESALGELFLRHHQRVLTLAYRTLGDWNKAEDITQETFLRIWKAADNYTPTAEFTTWLCRIVINLCLDEKRRSQRLWNMKNSIVEMQYANEFIKSQAESDINRNSRYIKNALMKLNKRQRHAVVLHKFHGLSYNEIANKTGWSQSAVDSLLSRAYRNLRNELVKNLQ